MELPETPPPDDPIAVITLVGNQDTEEALWLGALLAKLLAHHLAAANLAVLEYNIVAEQLIAGKHSLPLDRGAVEALKRSLRASVLIHGRYVLDEEGKMLGFRLRVEAPEVPAIPLETSSPLAGFERFIERVTLSLVEQLGMPIDDEIRQQISGASCPGSVEALRQLARAYAAWAKNQNELALVAVDSALALDGTLEEAAALEVAIAQTAHDTTTTRRAFRRWSEIAAKRGRIAQAADRLLLLGHWLAERGEWDEARRTYDDARNIYQRAQHEAGQAQAIHNIANLELVRGKIQNAIQAYRRNLRLFEDEAEPSLDMAGTLFNLALAHKSQGQQEEAMRAIEEAIKLARQEKDTGLEARCLTQRGALRGDMGQWAQASADYAQAARLLDVAGDDAARAVVKSHQGILLKQQGLYDQAETLMLDALEIFQDSHHTHEQAILWLNLADLYLAMGVYDQAWDYAERADEILRQLQSAWRERAQEILDTLESIPEEPTLEEETPPPTSEPPEFGPPPIGSESPPSPPAAPPPYSGSGPFRASSAGGTSQEPPSD